MERFGQHPDPRYTIIHLSDPHFLARGDALFGHLDTDRALEASIDRVATQLQRADAIVVTGDLADRGEADAYGRVADLLEPLATRLSAELVWVMGNHDERRPFSERLYGLPTERPQDRVVQLGGLRVVALDSTVPGYHHGALDRSQLDWLQGVLKYPSPDGTILALHHPPLASPVRIMGLIELRNVADLESVVAGTDVRAILAGHLHYPTFGTFAGIPVSVASATCYTVDPLAGGREFIGSDANHAFSLVEVFDAGIVHSVVSPFAANPVTAYPPDFIASLEAMSVAARDAAFSKKR